MEKKKYQFKKSKVIILAIVLVLFSVSLVFISTSTVMNGESTATKAVCNYGKNLKNIGQNKTDFTVSEIVCKYRFTDWCYFGFINESGQFCVAFCDYYDLLGSTYYWCKQVSVLGEPSQADPSTDWTQYGDIPYAVVRTDELDSFDGKGAVCEQFPVGGQSYTILFFEKDFVGK